MTTTTEWVSSGGTHYVLPAWKCRDDKEHVWPIAGHPLTHQCEVCGAPQWNTYQTEGRA